MGFDLCLMRSPAGDGGVVVRVGHPLLDAFLELVAARSRPNTVLASGFDLKVFFSVIDKDPVEVDTADVLAFIAAQREPRHGATVVRSRMVNGAVGPHHQASAGHDLWAV